MDNHGIKRAICRAKERRRALHSTKTVWFLLPFLHIGLVSNLSIKKLDSSKNWLPHSCWKDASLCISHAKLCINLIVKSFVLRCMQQLQLIYAL